MKKENGSEAVTHAYKEVVATKERMREVLAAFVVVARHARNFPHPQIPIERLRREAVEAEMKAENILGKKEYELINEKAFNQ